MKKTTRILTMAVAAVMAVVLCCGLMTMAVFAADGDVDPDTTDTGNSPATDSGSNSGSSSGVSSARASASARSSRGSAKSVPDLSGRYRTSLTKILANLDPAAIAQQDLVIDPVTNTVGNLYDREGNLIPCTLSSDGHFIIVPTNEGYAYVPTGK